LPAELFVLRGGRALLHTPTSASMALSRT
jgi:hypothetical protein